jgi:6-phosphogluconolactonase
MNITRTIDYHEKGKVLVAPDTKALDEVNAEMIVQSATDAIAARGRFTIALSGGSTPKPLYALMAEEPWRNRIDWSKTHFFWGDERWVPSTSNQSNYKMAYDAWLAKIPVPRENIHRMETDRGEPEEAAEEYENLIRNFFGDDPQFDFNLLGIGTNGHTASLFPGRPTLQIRERLVVADNIPEVHMWRITFTVPLINASRTIVFLVAGAEKAQVLHEVLLGPHDPERLPSQLIRAKRGSLIWLLDEPAAAELT